MDVHCVGCGEPWEMDSIHDEVSRRFPNKPWYVENKPERSNKPDTILPWCDVIIGEKNGLAQHCWEKENHPIHQEHGFIPQIQKEYKSYNNHPFVDKNTGLWFDDLIYEQHYEPVLDEFKRTGCATFDVPHNNTKANPAYATIYGMLGDDMDGAEALIEDAEYMGLIE